VEGDPRDRGAGRRDPLASEGFRQFWKRRSRPKRLGRPGLDGKIISLIRRVAQANVTWGAPRIRSELAKLGIEVAVSTVAKYMPRRRKPPSSTWGAFLENHLRDLVAPDFFVVPTATFGVLFGLVVLTHHRRRVVHFNARAHPTAVPHEEPSASRRLLALAGDAPEPRGVQGPELAWWSSSPRWEDFTIDTCGRRHDEQDCEKGRPCRIRADEVSGNHRHRRRRCAPSSIAAGGSRTSRGSVGCCRPGEPRVAPRGQACSGPRAPRAYVRSSCIV
jgi:hypothetical protein